MRDLPTGTVTFLFTDIEGSTRLLERLGDRSRDVLALHDAILRSAIAAGDGREVGTDGDSFFAAFASPTGAVQAAVEAQRSLAVTAWPEGAAVRVRMGLHTGEGVLGGANYLGLDVNRASRIAAAGHGGQVLLSGPTRGLVGRSLPPGTELRDLGEHRLKDFPEPDRLFQLVIDGLEEDFPPLRTTEVRLTNLPAQLTRFIGRAAEVTAIQGLIGDNRLVTLTGPGGTGKTRLALQVAAEAFNAYRDGVAFVDLSALTDPELVAPEIAGALQVRAESGREALEGLGDHLRAKELLLVLDNFEQLTEAGPSVLEPLLRGAPGLTVLVTSRIPLHLYGEREYQVPPLGLPGPDRLPDPDALLAVEAVALFAERAAAARPGFRVTEDNARAVVEITARLDGLPLAIELAASRVRLLSPDQLLARLEQRLPLLSARDRNVPERQRTLRRTIEWSYDLLDDPERRMFWRLSVFVGGADLEAIEAVANPDGKLGLDTLDGVGSLVDKNLLRRIETSAAEPRFTMLETIREFGLERLSESGEEPAIRQRHAEHWVGKGQRLSEVSPAKQAASIRLLEHELDNFRSALSWVIRSGEVELGLRLGAALRYFWRIGGHIREGLRWLEQILELPGAAEKALLRARALTAGADLSSWMGESGAYAHLMLAQEAVATYRELHDAAGTADALSEMGIALMGAGQEDAAIASLLEARQLNLDLGNRQKAAECTAGLGMVALNRRRPAEARATFEEALAAFRVLDDSYWVAFLERIVGGIDRFESDDEAADKRFRSSLSLAGQHDHLVVVASALYALADLAVARGQHDRALRLVGASEALRDRVGEPPPQEMEMVGDVRGAASAFLDEGAATSAYQEGRSMALHDAVAYALE